MLKDLRSALSMMIVMTILTGLLYPLAVTGLAQTVFPHQANGSLIEKDGHVVGSALIGQSFTREEYFWGRPSAAGNGYDAANSGGSNLGPTSKALADRVSARIAMLRTANPAAPNPVPADLVTTSGSGLDPDISPAAALWQVMRVAAARQVPEEEVRRLVSRQIEGCLFGVLGEPRVNVLQLNLTLDERWPLR